MTIDINTKQNFSELIKLIDVPTNEITVMGEVLIKAMAKLGIKYTGKTVLTPEEINTYRNLSGEEMARLHIKKHAIDKINHVLILLQEIKMNNDKGRDHFNMKERLENLGMPYEFYSHIFRSFKNELLFLDGERASTTYTWMPDRPVTYSDAEYFYRLYEKMKQTQLNPKQRLVVDQHMNKSPEELARMCKVTDPVDLLCFTFRAKIRIKQLEQYERIREAKKNKKKPPIVTEVETRNKLPEGNSLRANQPTLNGHTPAPTMEAFRQAEITPETKHAQDLADLLAFSPDETTEQSIIYILNERNQLMMQLLKNYQKYSAKLEHQIIHGRKEEKKKDLGQNN